MSCKAGERFSLTAVCHNNSSGISLFKWDKGRWSWRLSLEDNSPTTEQRNQIRQANCECEEARSVIFGTISKVSQNMDRIKSGSRWTWDERWVN